VKRRGKSPLRHWRQCRKDSGNLPENGKPHQEQSQIALVTGITGYIPIARWINAGRLQKRTGNGSFRQMAAVQRLAV